LNEPEKFFFPVDEIQKGKDMSRSDCAVEWLVGGPLIIDLSLLVQAYAQEFDAQYNGVQFQVKEANQMVILGDNLAAFRVRFGPIQVFDVRSGTCVQTIDSDAHTMVADGTQIITCSYNLHVRTLDALSGNCTSARRIQGAYETIPGHAFYHLSMLPGRQLALRTASEGIRVWDMHTGFERCRIKLREVRDVLGLPDGRLVASVDHLIYVYRDRELLLKRRCHKKSVVTKLQTVGEHYMASGGADNSINIWKTDTMTCVRVIGEVNPHFFHVLRDGNLAAVTTGKEERIKAYDLELEGVHAAAVVECSSVVCGWELWTTTN
jgi:hypothetical protein